MAKRKKKPEPAKPSFSAWENLCPYCGVKLGYGYDHTGPTWLCTEHGHFTKENLERGQKWIISSQTLGDALVIRKTDQFDSDKRVLGLGLPVFTEACLGTMKALPTPEAKRAFWIARGRDIEDERRLRAADPTRTAFYPGDVIAAENAARRQQA